MSAGNYVEYSSNNSGGSWWLTAEDWKALEEGGWEVKWCDFLGAVATSAKRYGISLREAVEEFERLTGACATDAGCPCCGPPHSFTEYAPDGTFVVSGPSLSYSAHW